MKFLVKLLTLSFGFFLWQGVLFSMENRSHLSVTTHALRRMNQRGISAVEIANAIHQNSSFKNQSKEVSKFSCDGVTAVCNTKTGILITAYRDNADKTALSQPIMQSKDTSRTKWWNMKDWKERRRNKAISLNRRKERDIKESQNFDFILESQPKDRASKAEFLL